MNTDKDLALSSAARWGLEARRYILKALNPGHCCRASAAAFAIRATHFAVREAFLACPELKPPAELEPMS